MRKPLFLLALFAMPLACSAPDHALPWIANDYAGAVAMARERGTPLFIEAWAPW